MQYNSNATNQDLVSLLNDLTGMDNNTYSIEAKTRDMNRANKQIWTWIHKAYGGWQYDDSNNTTDFPKATTTLTADQQDYQLPSEALTVKFVEVKTTGGVWQRLQPITEEQVLDFMSEKEFMDTSSQPIYYVPFANSIKIYPASNYTQAASLRVSYNRGSTSFTTTDTTKTPGFSSEYHEAVAVGAGVFFSTYKTIPQKNDLFIQWQDYERRIKDDYSSRYAQLFPNRITVRDAVRENM